MQTRGCAAVTTYLGICQLNDMANLSVGSCQTASQTCRKEKGYKRCLPGSCSLARKQWSSLAWSAGSNGGQEQ